jgi:hypothetical protein
MYYVVILTLMDYDIDFFVLEWTKFVLEIINKWHRLLNVLHMNTYATYVFLCTEPVRIVSLYPEFQGSLGGFCEDYSLLGNDAI